MLVQATAPKPRSAPRVHVSQAPAAGRAAEAAAATDQAAPLAITEVPDSPVPVFLLGRQGDDGPWRAVVRRGTPQDVIDAHIAQLTAEWDTAVNCPADMEAECDNPDDAKCRCASCSALLAQDARYGEPAPIVAAEAPEILAQREPARGEVVMVAPFDHHVAETGDVTTERDDQDVTSSTGHHASRSGEGIERMRSVQDEHDAHAQLLQGNRDPVAEAAAAVDSLRGASAAARQRAAQTEQDAVTEQRQQLHYTQQVSEEHGAVLEAV